MSGLIIPQYSKHKKMETYIEKEITNCGLIALRNLSPLRDVSIRSLVFIAEDNGLSLFAYKIPLSEVYNVPLPAIFHAENHFIYASKREDIDGYKLTGNVLLTQKTNYEEISGEDTKNIIGASWAAAIAGSVAATGAIVKGIRARKQRKAAEKIKPVRPTMERTTASKEQEDMARQAAGSTRIPGQAYLENQIGAQTARSNAAIQQAGGSTGEIIGGLTAADENARRATNDLAFQGAQLNQQNKQMFSNVLGRVSDEQREIFDYNRNQSYQTDVLRKQALLDSSARNADNAFSSAQDAGDNFGVAYGYSRAGRQSGQEDFNSDPSAGTGKTRRSKKSDRINYND